MAYVTVPNSDVDPDSPITTSLVTALRDNPTQDDTPLSSRAGASKVLIDTKTASASATIDFTTGIDGTYDKYVIEITNLDAATTGQDVQMQISQAGAFIAGSSYNWMSDETLSDGTGSKTAGLGVGFIRLTNSLESTLSTASFNSTIKFSSPDNTTYYKHFDVSSTYNSTANYVKSIVGGIHASALAMDGVRFKMSSGNISSGVFRLYGIKDA